MFAQKRNCSSEWEEISKADALQYDPMPVEMSFRKTTSRAVDSMTHYFQS